MTKCSTKTTNLCHCCHVPKSYHWNRFGNILPPTTLFCHQYCNRHRFKKSFSANPFLLQWLTEILSFLSRLSPLIWLTVIENFSHSGFTVFLITSVLCRFRFPAQSLSLKQKDFPLQSSLTHLHLFDRPIDAKILSGSTRYATDKMLTVNFLAGRR